MTGTLVLVLYPSHLKSYQNLKYIFVSLKQRSLRIVLRHLNKRLKMVNLEKNAIILIESLT